MSKQKEPWDLTDPYYQAAVEMAKELRGQSARNQALALVVVRRRNPKLCATLVKILKTTDARTVSPPAEEKPLDGNT